MWYLELSTVDTGSVLGGCSSLLSSEGCAAVGACGGLWRLLLLGLLAHRSEGVLSLALRAVSWCGVKNKRCANAKRNNQQKETNV